MERKRITLNLIVNEEKVYSSQGELNVGNPHTIAEYPIKWDGEKEIGCRVLGSSEKSLNESYFEIMCVGESMFHPQNYKLEIEVEKMKDGSM